MQISDISFYPDSQIIEEVSHHMEIQHIGIL